MPFDKTADYVDENASWPEASGAAESALERLLDRLSRTTFQPRPVVGWPLPLLVRLDQALPGTLSRILVASPLRRACTFATLATVDLDAPHRFVEHLPADAQVGCDPLVRIAYAITRHRVRETLLAAYGGCPPGLIGALQRVGHEPLHRPDIYRLLHRFFSEPALQAKGRALRYQERITSYTIEIVDALDSPHLLTPGVVKALGSAPEARQLVEAISYLKRMMPIDEERVAEALTRLGAGTSVRRMLTGWIERADLPVRVPDLPDPAIRPLRSTGEIRAAGLTYRNCLKSKTIEALLGRTAYIEVPMPEDDGSVIIELTPLEAEGARTCWLVESVNAVGNRRVQPDAERAIRARLTSLGCLERMRPSRFGVPAGLGRVLWSHYGWDDYEDEAA